LKLTPGTAATDTELVTSMMLRISSAARHASNVKMFLPLPQRGDSASSTQPSKDLALLLPLLLQFATGRLLLLVFLHSRLIPLHATMHNQEAQRRQ
jgi:hypothetical protein